MHYVFDIDGTICTMPNSESTYEEAEPIIDRIEKINALFDTGNRIIFHTARGMRTFKNDGKKAHNKYYSLTYDQLNNWGVKFHKLIMGKPSGDLYVDDKGVKDEEFFRN
jgi:hypothetical protein|tara:strand:- start:22 stop:348 length:327 start_codon:yes stop_codon:yes gene_type:complete